MCYWGFGVGYIGMKIDFFVGVDRKFEGGNLVCGVRGDGEEK